MSKLIYCESLERWSIDNGFNPLFTVAVNGKGEIAFFGSDKMSNAQRLELIGKAFQVMHGITEQEKNAIQTATPLDMDKLKPIR